LVDHVGSSDSERALATDGRGKGELIHDKSALVPEAFREVARLILIAAVVRPDNAFRRVVGLRVNG
jgi:hypothetical protein